MRKERARIRCSVVTRDVKYWIATMGILMLRLSCGMPYRLGSIPLGQAVTWKIENKYAISGWRLKSYFGCTSTSSAGVGLAAFENTLFEQAFGSTANPFSLAGGVEELVTNGTPGIRCLFSSY